MPDRPIRKTGDNEYMTDWDDPNHLRSLFGLKLDPYALQSSEEVNVTAPRPKFTDPYPKNMDEIYLGTRTLPPTGTYTPNRTFTTKAHPALQGNWNEVVNRYPFIQNSVENVGKDTLSPGVLGMQEGTNIVIDADQAHSNRGMMQTMAHEATHAAQFNQFPDGEKRGPHNRNWENYFGARVGWQPGDPVEQMGRRPPAYNKRPGEQLAREAGAAASSKLYDEIYNTPEERARRERMYYINFGKHLPRER